MNISSGKLRTLYLMKILLDKTDENHKMTATDLEKALHDYDLTADRKTIYNDVETLQEFGIDILQEKGTNAGYYVASREFELPELKLLVDAVQSSKFISRKKSADLIKKLEHLASEHDAKQLQRNVFIYNRTKSENETIYYNVDQIHTAILENKQIEYKYAEWTVKKDLVPKKEGALYTVSPWTLTWDDENYYLIAYDEKADAIKHYRVDKMQQTRILDKDRLGKEKFQDFDLAEFAKKTFAMYGGHDENVSMVCHKDIVGVILDRFGTDIMMVPVDDEHFRVHLPITVSQQFFGWVTGLGKKIVIDGPATVQNEYKKYLKDILDTYKKK